MPSSSAPRSAVRTVGRAGARAVAVVVALGVGAAVLAGCGGDDPAVTTVRTGEVVDASDTAYVGNHPVVFMVPSGRVTVRVDDLVSSVAPIDTADGTSLLAAPGTGLVGLTWTLDRGAYPDSVNYDVASPATVLGGPRTVGLALEAGGVRYEVPGVGTMAGFGVHPSSTVWLGVPADAAPSSLRVQVDYAGVTQTGAVASGRVAAGRAAPLYATMPRDRATPCEVSGPDRSRCQLDDGVGFPYLDAVGWAPAGQHYALVAVRTAGVVRAVTLDGRREVTAISSTGGPDGTGTLHAFLLPDGAGPHRLRGLVQRDGRSRVLTATIAGATGPAVGPVIEPAVPPTQGETS